MIRKLELPKILLPRAKQKELGKVERDKKIRKYKDLKKAFNLVFSTKEGTAFGKWLVEECNFLSTSIVLTKDNKVSRDAVIFNEGRRSVYLDIRTFLDNNNLINLETKEEE